MTPQPTVFIVDDDEAVRDALSLLVRSVDLPSESFAGAREFLAASADSRPGCLVLDVRMPDLDGLELQRQLAARGSRMPIIMLTGHGDVPMAVQALRAGALDFIPKPFDSRALLRSIREAIDLDARTRQKHVDRAAIEARLAKLTPRETEVLNHIVDGLPSKAIAAALGSSFNTVQNQRASILRKMQAESVADLVRMVMIARAG
ncbi:MAG TPA: response regulator [Planctomycetaceae bacterium]|jgi:FixJ family two-component response regulator|nr:response regulator [Planctomycetaceae bacterium]